MHPGFVVYFIDIDRKAVSHPGWHTERRVQCGGGYRDGIPDAGYRVPHSPEQLPIERVHVQARCCGPPLGLGVKPFLPRSA
jgi:hypothetical protein